MPWMNGKKGLAVATILGVLHNTTAAVLLVYAYYDPEFSYFRHELAIPAALGVGMRMKRSTTTAARANPMSPR